VDRLASSGGARYRLLRCLPLLDELVRKLRARPAHTPPDGAVAAVATVFREGPAGPEVLYIERATRDGDPWSGHIAFPGGRRDPADASLLATAVRETLEEVALALPPQALVTRLDDFVALRFSTQVAQFVFALDGDCGPLAPNREVASLLWTPVATLVSPEHAATYRLDHDGQTLELPAVRLGSHVLWGMTYRMTQALLEALA
jgi:8-oxo-dGTP pyrophosphatase MutT (NUDIX family)